MAKYLFPSDFATIFDRWLSLTEKKSKILVETSRSLTKILGTPLRVLLNSLEMGLTLSIFIGFVEHMLRGNFFSRRRGDVTSPSSTALNPPQSCGKNVHGALPQRKGRVLEIMLL